MQVTVIGGGVAGACARSRCAASAPTSPSTRPTRAPPAPSARSSASPATDSEHSTPSAASTRYATVHLYRHNGCGRLAADPTHGVTLRRADLVTVLRDAAARAGARIVTGENVVAATDAGDHVQASFDSGNTVDSDLLIGADGIWSTVRAILDANAPRPAYAGMYSVSGLSATRTEPGVFTMIVGRAGAFIHVAGPDGTTWWSAQVAEPSAPDLAAVNLPMLLDRYRHEEQVVAVLRQATTMHQPTLDHVLDPVPTWRSDRTVIVGDAAHPVGAGQGASMAIEDAIVLAQRLTLGNGLPAALAAYEDARRARTTRMFKAGQDNRARKKVPGPVRRRVNETVMSFGLKHFYEKAMGWLYTYDVGELPARV